MNLPDFCYQLLVSMLRPQLYHWGFVDQDPWGHLCSPPDKSSDALMCIYTLENKLWQSRIFFFPSLPTCLLHLWLSVLSHASILAESGCCLCSSCGLLWLCPVSMDHWENKSKRTRLCPDFAFVAMREWEVGRGTSIGRAWDGAMPSMSPTPRS